MNRLKVFGIAFFISGFLILALGLSTYAWVKTEIIELETNKFVSVQNGYRGVDGYGARTAYRGGGKIEWQSVLYTYEYKNRIYKSRLIGFHLPFNNKLPISGGQAYVLSFAPSLSVLLRGVDYRLVGILWIIGGALLYVRHWLFTLLNKNT